MSKRSKRPATPERFVRTASDRKALEEGCYYSEAHADHVVEFFEQYLAHSKGRWAGQPFKLLEWQEWEIIRPLFGWLRADGTRRFRKAYIEVPKKNGKSTLSAGIALYLLKGDGEAGAEVYSVALDAAQASIVFREAANMVRKSQFLSQVLWVTESTKVIADPLSASFYKALSAEVGTKEGLNIHGLIFDELHAQKSRSLWDALQYGGAARRQPMFVSITTAGYDRESICWEQHVYAERVLDGRIVDTTFLPFVRSAPVDADWQDEKTWAMANPSFGTTISVHDFREAAKGAQVSGAAQNAFRRYRLNQWVQQEVRWLDMGRWRACKAEPVEIGPEHRQVKAWGGLDLASTADIAAYVQVIPELGNLIRCWFFIPEERLRDRVARDRVPYDSWLQSGHLIATRGNTIDQDAIKLAILRSGEEVDLQEVAYDRWNASKLVTELQDEGVKMVPIGQGFATMTAPSKHLETLVYNGELNHQGHPVLEWMANNVATEIDAAGNLKPSKAKSTEKIDGIVAVIMALARIIVKPPEAAPAISFL